VPESAKQVVQGGAAVRQLTDGSFERPADLTDTSDPKVLYARSYLLHRAIVGVLGILLPLGLIVAEAFLDGSVLSRGSLSAYYHTSARDLFVGTLCVIGVLLITYLAGQPDTKDFWLSLVAGIAVLLVVAFPTARPDLDDGAAACGSLPVPPGCAPVQQRLGELPVAVVHFVAAAIFIVSLALLCFLFAARERRHLHNDGLARFLAGCGWTIFLAIAWIVVGTWLDLTIWQLTPLYLGEVVAVWAFGAAWLVKSRHLLRRLSVAP
jgi:hypothetical protein